MKILNFHLYEKKRKRKGSPSISFHKLNKVLIQYEVRLCPLKIVITMRNRDYEGGS